MRSPLPLAALALLGLLAGCSAPPAPADAPTAGDPPPAHAGHDAGSDPAHAGHDSGLPALWAVQSGPLGVVATDGAGHLLYRSDADTAAPSASTCTGDCATTWIPLVVAPGQQPETLGVDGAKVGHLTRADGTEQLTLAGWPLYYNRDDAPGLVDAGHNGADGKWFVITPTGAKVRPS